MNLQNLCTILNESETALFLAGLMILTTFLTNYFTD